MAWYRERGPGLAEDLERSFYAALARIHREPLLYLAARGEVRRAILDRFPYALWFRVEGDVVVVFLLWHSSRNPAARSRMLRQREANE